MLLKAFYIAVPLLIVELFYLGYRTDCKIAQRQEHVETLRVLTAIKEFSESQCNSVVNSIMKECDTYKSTYNDSVRTDMESTLRLTDSLSVAKSSIAIKVCLDSLSMLIVPDSIHVFKKALQDICNLRNIENDTLALNQKVVDQSCALHALYIRELVLRSHLKRLNLHQYAMDSATVIVWEAMKRLRAGDTWEGDIFLAHYKSQQPIEVTINGRAIAVVNGLARDTLWQEPKRQKFSASVLQKNPLTGEVKAYKKDFEYPTARK